MSLYDHFKDRQAAISEIVSETIKHCYVHPVTLKIVLKPFEEFANQSIDFGGFSVGLLEELETLPKDISWETLVFGPNITKLHIHSEKNGNDDTRGGGCGRLRLPVSDFQYEIENKGGITLADLTEAAYRMKGSKYDWWYELYSGITITKKTDSQVYTKIKFDYGS